MMQLFLFLKVCIITVDGPQVVMFAKKVADREQRRKH